MPKRCGSDRAGKNRKNETRGGSESELRVSQNSVKAYSQTGCELGTYETNESKVRRRRRCIEDVILDDLTVLFY